MTQIPAGRILDPILLTSARGQKVPIPDPDSLVHLQFRRYAGCPICNLHLRTFVTRHAELAEAGIREVVVFHSSQKTMAEYAGGLPFDLIADPAMKLYRRFGVTTSWRAIAHPRAWLAAVRGWSWSLPSQLDDGDGGHLGLPADFLIAPDGHVLARHYGRHANDQWTFDDVLEQTRTHTSWNMEERPR